MKIVRSTEATFFGLTSIAWALGSYGGGADDGGGDGVVLQNAKIAPSYLGNQHPHALALRSEQLRHP